ncbi:MAG: protein kinase, partial [Myxococcales bacterium]|nr:protein kinase [Myxococcales bacterium]
MGRVFLARDTRLARLCAIKLLLAYSGERAERFLSEARATARCKHESIVVVYEVDELHGFPYMVLEYIEGRTLREWMRERGGEGPLPPRVAAEMMIPVVQALVCAHEMGIVHRDLKPENILLTEAGQIKVLDFGVAKQVASDLAVSAGEDPQRERSLVGSPPYMSPEQWQDLQVDGQTDLWAVGIMLHELAAGAHPLAPAGPAQLAAICDLGSPMPVRIGPAAPALHAVISRCLQKRRSERTGSARLLLAELEALAADAPGPLGEHNPFAGLSAFQEAGSGHFFGRERDTAAVVGRLRQHQLVVVAGPSGAGKSSLVRAGVIPALKRAGGRWEAFIVRPGRRPLAALADVVAALAPGADGEALVELLQRQPGLLGARLRARCRGGDHHALLFVDQFEELYTLTASPSERAAFLACLAGAADEASSPVRVIVAIRSDFLDRIADDRRFTAEVTRGLVLLSPLGHEGLRRALVRPIELAGYRFEGDELVDEMLAMLARTRSPLPLLQFTATLLWEARDGARRLISRASYDALGGVAGALSTHADAVLMTLSPREQRLARSILLRLVTPERTRAIVALPELRGLSDGDDAAAQVVARLADARLLQIESGDEREGSTVELVHESLIDRWTRLREWLDETEHDAQFLARLRVAAQQWRASGRAPGLRWREHAAQDARAWLARRDAEHDRVALAGDEQQYLAAVVDRFDRALRRRRRRVIGVISVLTAIAFVVSYLAMRAEQAADRAREESARAAAQAVRADAE